MKHEDFERVKLLCEEISELEKKRSEICNSDTLQLCTSGGYPFLKILMGKNYEIEKYQSYAYQFRDSVLSDIDKEVERLKNKLEEL